MAAIVESSEDAIISKTLGGVIRSWNGGAERLFGYTAREAVGQSITLIIPPERHDEEHGILARLRRGERIEHFETVRVAKDGRRIDISLTVSPVLDHDGRVIGASKVAHDITERKQVDAALREADRRKDEFLALLAHELRNPLAPLRNGLQVLRLAGGDADTVTQVRAMMDRQLGHMVRLIDDLLDISRIGQNKIELRRARVPLAAIIDSAVETARPSIEAEGHELSVSLPTDPLFLDADLTRLAQVFSNLLSNSAKYTPPGGHIWLTADRQGDNAVVTVQDDGIGIPADALPRVFDMFAQVDRSIERATGGLGIGLSLVKSLVEMHGGRVSAASDGPGKGSIFTVRLPALITIPEPSSAATAQDVPLAAGNRRRILVVDDNRDAALTLAKMLRLLGNELRTAHDGLQATEKAEEFRPEVILMDVGMPGLNGYEANSLSHHKHSTPPSNLLHLSTVRAPQFLVNRHLHVAARFFAAMPRLLRHIAASDHIHEVVLPPLVHIIHNRLMQRLLLSFQCQHIIRFAIHDLFRNAFLCSHRVHRHHRAFHTYQRRKLRNARDFVPFLRAAHFPQPQSKLPAPDAHRMQGAQPFATIVPPSSTRRIREQPWARKVIIIALTGWGQEGDRTQSREAGCDGHLVKPVSLTDLEQMLAKLS